MASAGDGDLRHQPHHADLLESGRLVRCKPIPQSSQYAGFAAYPGQFEALLSRAPTLSHLSPASSLNLQHSTFKFFTMLHPSVFSFQHYLHKLSTNSPLSWLVVRVFSATVDDPGGNSPAANRRDAYRVWLDRSELQGAEPLRRTRHCRPGSAAQDRTV